VALRAKGRVRPESFPFHHGFESSFFTSHPNTHFKARWESVTVENGTLSCSIGWPFFLTLLRPILYALVPFLVPCIKSPPCPFANFGSKNIWDPAPALAWAPAGQENSLHFSRSNLLFLSFFHLTVFFALSFPPQLPNRDFESPLVPRSLPPHFPSIVDVETWEFFLIVISGMVSYHPPGLGPPLYGTLASLPLRFSC